ncbi:hypothetical protein [Bordetella genomosp. 10]|uniref:hypothetical protein n=1 Tax=Bordetella genomosp. 10 TaxID=1416804 RepID=UPI001178C71D|nr:hypothetical protein [Bordetella genomosp. 10]
MNHVAIKPARKPASPTFIACLLVMTLFAFAAAVSAFNPNVGSYLQTTHWTIGHLALFLGTLALASGIAGITARFLARGAWAWLLACVAWLLVVAVMLLFVFRYPAEFYVRYSKNVVEDHVPDVLEQQALSFDNSARRNLWGTSTTYRLTWVGPITSCITPGTAAPGQCKLMECVRARSSWLAGGDFQHFWGIEPYTESADGLRNAQCHEVDPSAIKAADYDEQGQRIVQ